MRSPHYAFVVLAVTFVAILATQVVRSAPGVIIRPLEAEYGWDRASISLAVAASILIFGLAGPLGGWLIDRFGPRKITVGGGLSVAMGLVVLLLMREQWQLYLAWGLFIGAGTGAVGGVLGPAIAHRWFRKMRGVVIGLFGGAIAAGQLILVPVMGALTVSGGWRSAITLLLIVGLVALVPAAILMRDRPSDVGQRAYGESDETAAEERAADARRTPLSRAVRTGDFWLLAGSFFICGYTSNGLIGTHLIPHAVEHGFTEVTAATAVGLLGAMNIVGTLASGWLSDRYDNRRLLAMYYGFRAISLVALPLIYDVQWLVVFAIVYGLDWIATVPPTANLIAMRFGRASLATIYGWVWFSHMVGGALAAYAGGFFRVLLGDYHLMFLSAAVMGFIAVALALRISDVRRILPAPAPAGM